MEPMGFLRNQFFRNQFSVLLTGLGSLAAVPGASRLGEETPSPSPLGAWRAAKPHPDRGVGGLR